MTLPEEDASEIRDTTSSQTKKRGRCKLVMFLTVWLLCVFKILETHGPVFAQFLGDGFVFV